MNKKARALKNKGYRKTSNAVEGVRHTEKETIRIVNAKGTTMSKLTGRAYVESND